MSATRLDELLSAAEDQALSPAERAELERLLAASPDARRARARFQDLGAYLGQVAPVAPPGDLAGRILAGVRTPSPAPRQARPLAWRRLFAPPLLGYGFAAAAGALLTVMLFESGPAPLAAPDLSRLTGSLAPVPGTDALVDSVEFETDGITALARLTRVPDALVLDVRFDAGQPLRVEAVSAHPGLVFVGTMNEPSASPAGNHLVATLASDRLVIDGRGRQAVAALLRLDAGADGTPEIRLVFSSGGRVHREESLVFDQQHDGRLLNSPAERRDNGE